MSAPTPAAAPVKAKSKKLIVIGAVLALLVIVGAGAAWFPASRSHAEEDDGSAPPPKEVAKVAPTFLPLENMVVNLADPGGDRFAQIGITLEVSDAKTAEQIKQYLPSIRSGILLLVSQRTSEELLQREGKEKLATDIFSARSLARWVIRCPRPSPAAMRKRTTPKSPRRAARSRKILCSACCFPVSSFSELVRIFP